MEPLTVAQEALLGRTGERLRERFGELVVQSPDEPAFFVGLGATGVRIDVQPFGDDEAVLEAYCWLAQGLRVDAEVGLFLARENVELRIGSLCIDGENAILLQHALFTDSLTTDTLERVVRLLAGLGEQLESELRSRFS